MCGFSVVVALHGTRFGSDEDVEGQLEASLDRIAHRGPDSRGVWVSEDRRVALGHCRLSINDLSTGGDQPLHSEGNNAHAVVIGEIYDHDRIRDELIKEHKFTFRGRSDSELVIALYQVYGESFLSKLRGEFSLCLYDSKKRYLMAARDRYGIKPLFWTIVGDRLLLSAEAKGFLPLGWKPEWDVESLLSAGWNHDARTQFKGVYKVRPGHYLTLPSFGLPEARQYWEVSYRDKFEVETRTVEEMVAGVREKLLEATRLRLRADVPVGIYLSGGIDSSVLAGMVTHLVKEQGERMGSQGATDRICCFSIAFDETSGFDESDFANRTAEWLGVRYLKISMDEQALADNFEDTAYHNEHHFHDLNTVGKFALSQLPRDEGFKVVLTGEGADEQFAGYPSFRPDLLLEADHSWPGESGLEDGERQRRHSETKELLKKIYAGGGGRFPDDVPTAAAASRQLNNICTAAAMGSFECPRSLYAGWTECYGSATVVDTIASSISVREKNLIKHSWHPLHSALYTWQKGHLANILLTSLGDRTEMAHSIEARPPFLDHELAEYVNNLPPSMKMRWDSGSKRFIEKWVLREAGRPFVTDELYRRAKHPYTAPITYPVGGPVHKLIQRLVTRETVEQLGFVDWNVAKDLLDQAFVSQESRAMRCLFGVASWVTLSQRFGVARAECP